MPPERKEPGKVVKLVVHQRAYADEDIVINPREFSWLNIGDVVELYHPDDSGNRLLLQITCLREDIGSKDAVSIDQSIANSFGLKPYKEVVINSVAPETVSVDLVELTLKEQFISRGDMWHFKRALCGKGVYVQKKLELAKRVRFTVREVWKKGVQVTSGLISEHTKLVFRSLSSFWNIFIQMSLEMWDFDAEGDLYFEKAVDGFLSELFTRWREEKCAHDVTVTLFSRLLYDKAPAGASLQRTSRGQLYQDFYRVVIQNERYDDLFPVCIPRLKQYFHEYEGWVQSEGGRNSRSEEGNFLEVLNMASNVYERFHIDRTFDRTGQMCLVLTPGVALFEVDRALSALTKQRHHDYGIGVDLVCLGEAPVHLVPLFRCKDGFDVPHWLNVSFYGSSGGRVYAPAVLPVPAQETRSSSLPLSCEAMGEHDAHVFSRHAEHDVRHDGHVLTNPFCLEAVRSFMQPSTSRRRWAHTFPMDPQGEPVQAHHRTLKRLMYGRLRGSDKEMDEGPQHADDMLGRLEAGEHDHDAEWAQDWTMGVDWKSLTFPAVLPLTIDRGESARETRTQYFVLVDEKEVALHNLVSLRLALGFQLVQEDVHAKQSYTLSMGDTVHVIRDFPKDDQLEVCIFSSNVLPPACPFEYSYRFRAPDGPVFESSRCRFELNRPDSLSWSNVDNSYLCYGSSSKETAPLVPWELVARLHLEETEKEAWHSRYLREVAECRFWRSRFFLLPAIHAATKRISEGCSHCDIYRAEGTSPFEWESFVRFADTVNSIRRSSARSRSSTANRRPAHKERLSVEAGDDALLSALWDAVGFPLTGAGTCLISYEAVQWLREHVDDADPLELLQRWVSETRLRLVSCPSATGFRHGYFVYGTEPRAPDRPLLEAYFGKPSDQLRVLEFPEGTFLLHSHCFSPPSAFELQLCWLSADSALINDMLQGWARRASALGLHLVPVPCAPFLWPGQSDPLRGPLRIPLSFPAEKAFLVASLAKFGFVCDSGQNEDHLVHVTGAAFVHVSGELLWWWNFMLGRRWRSSNTGDDAMWDRLLADVRAFFHDDAGRLHEAWSTWSGASRDVLAHMSSTLHL